MSFENRLGRLLKDEDPYASGPDPVPIIAAARRRRARRRAGTGAAVVAVALVCGATAVTAGNARHVGRIAGEAGAAMTPSAGAVMTPSAGVATQLPGTATATPSYVPSPLPTRLLLSPVKRVAAGERIQITENFRMWVTPTEKCQDVRTGGVWSPGANCWDLRSDNLDHDKPNVAAQMYSNKDAAVVASYYLGPSPSTIVAYRDGIPTTATLVTTAGMQGWTGYYVVLPPMPERDPAIHRPSVSPAIGVYDATGALLASLPGFATDGSDEKVPDRL
ncbi:hypothetical protein ACIRRH_04080 [Kitasatospora sp. NPDC101235]|uniref:hypothetical protein n=1 Tax=Kitasatospora sp. NPDC101235 TaxID=3364101 RepID=UPI003813B88C